MGIRPFLYVSTYLVSVHDIAVCIGKSALALQDDLLEYFRSFPVVNNFTDFSIILFRSNYFHAPRKGLLHVDFE